MKLRNALAVTAALTLAAAPAVAEVSFDRATAPSDDASALGEGGLEGSSLIIALLAAAAVVGAIIIAVDDDDNEAVSP